jgi:hypothetical protein
MVYFKILHGGGGFSQGFFCDRCFSCFSYFIKLQLTRKAAS